MICSLNSYRKGCPGSIQPWLSLGHFVGCCWVGRDRSSFNGGAMDPSRLKGESVVFGGGLRDPLLNSENFVTRHSIGALVFPDWRNVASLRMSAVSSTFRAYWSLAMPGDEIRTEPLVIVRNVERRSLQSPSPKSSRQQRKFFAGFFQISRIFSVLEPRSRATKECKKARTHLTRVKTRPLFAARRRGTSSLPC